MPTGETTWLDNSLQKLTVFGNQVAVIWVTSSREKVSLTRLTNGEFS